MATRDPSRRVGVLQATSDLEYYFADPNEDGLGDLQHRLLGMRAWGEATPQGLWRSGGGMPPNTNWHQTLIRLPEPLKKSKRHVAEDSRKNWRPPRRPEAVRAAVVSQVAALLANHQTRVREGNVTEEDTFLLRTTLKDRLCWAWTMAAGGDAFTKFAKLLAQPWWSHGALRSYALHGDAVLRGRRDESLLHEHVVPRGASPTR